MSTGTAAYPAHSCSSSSAATMLAQLVRADPDGASAVAPGSCSAETGAASGAKARIDGIDPTGGSGHTACYGHHQNVKAGSDDGGGNGSIKSRDGADHFTTTQKSAGISSAAGEDCSDAVDHRLH